MLQCEFAVGFGGGTDPHHFVVDRCDIFDAGGGVRFSGHDIVVSRSHVHHVATTLVGAGAGLGAWDVTIQCNHLHDADIPTDELCYEEGNWASSHASSISIRGHDYRLVGNHIHDAMLGIQLYDDDAGGTYDISNIVLERNFIYDLSHSSAFYF